MAEALARAAAASPLGRRPEAFGEHRGEKKNYAQRLSNELALCLATCLRPYYPRARITPRPDGSGQEFSIGAKLDSKRTDVGVWDDAAGLILGISVKTYSFRDYHGATRSHPAHLGRYVKNVKRNDMELRDEADVLHRRQPYAVLYALFFLPKDACWDGVNGHSSFAHAVFTFRKRAGRPAADAGRTDLFEKVYIGLLDDDGAVDFFDVERPPPRNQPPQKTVDLAAVIESMCTSVVVRNEGVAPGERYAGDDPTWVPPGGSLPAGLEADGSLGYAEAIAGGSDEDDETS
ncbi:MAG: hypothetical protein ACRDYD_08905 [Acidimicrobiales bacterium]